MSSTISRLKRTTYYLSSTRDPTRPSCSARRASLLLLRRRSAASSKQSRQGARKSPGCRRTCLMRAHMPAGWNRSSAAVSSAPTNIRRPSPRPGRSKPRFSTRNRSWRSKRSVALRTGNVELLLQYHLAREERICDRGEAAAGADVGRLFHRGCGLQRGFSGRDASPPRIEGEIRFLNSEYHALLLAVELQIGGK